MILTSIIKYFDFLEQRLSFTRIQEYNYVREVHTDYIKGNVILNISWEGSYSVTFFNVPSDVAEEIIAEKKKAAKIDYFSRYRYDLSKLDPGNRLYNSVSGDNFPDKDLWYYSTLLKRNPEILDGDMRAFQLYTRILNRLKFRNGR